MSAQKPVDLDALAGHTTGKWFIERNSSRQFVVRGPPRNVNKAPARIAMCGSQRIYETQVEAEDLANARLICAAPAMRAELIARRNRDAAVERLIAAADRLAAAANDMALRRNDGGADPSIREVLEALAAVRGGAK